MSNLFKQNLEPSHVQALKAMQTNIAFVERLVSDLTETFDVRTEAKRRGETEFEIVVYAPRQAGRYGWGFTFNATPDGVTFYDGRGVWLKSIAKVLGAKVTDEYEKKDADLDALKRAAEAIGVSVKCHPDTACGDHYKLTVPLSEADAQLNDKLKAIIGVMQEQYVKTRLGGAQ